MLKNGLKFQKYQLYYKRRDAFRSALIRRFYKHMFFIIAYYTVEARFLIVCTVQKLKENIINIIPYQIAWCVS